MKRGISLSFIEMIYNVDFAILGFIQTAIKCAFLDPIMAVVSYVGEAGAVWIAASIVMICFRKTRSVGVMVLCAITAGYIIGELGIKNIVCRPRPFIENPDIVLNIYPPSGYSFPSGHSCSSFAAAIVMLLCDKRLGIPAAVLAALVAFSRLYNYVHFPSDVLCGIILGVICAVITVFVFRKTKLDKKLSGGSGNEKNKLERADNDE